MKEKKIKCNVQIDETDYKRIKDIADKKEWSLAQVLRKLIKYGLKYFVYK